MPAHYVKSISRFLDDSAETIIGGLSVAASSKGFYQHLHSQTKSWEEQIDSLKGAFLEIVSKGYVVRDWYILLEYPIPRREKRIDTVVLTEKSILVIEYKCGAKIFDLAAKLQVEDYCLDLRDFHLESKDFIIVPVTVLLISSRSPGSVIYLFSLDVFIQYRHGNGMGTGFSIIYRCNSVH